MTTLPLLTIPVGQHVLVRVDGAAVLPATVVAVTDDELTLVLAASEPGLAAVSGLPTTVEWAAGLGHRRCAGELLAGGDRSELLRVRLQDGAELVHRRRWSRVEAVLPILVTLVDDPGAGGRTTTVDVGGGGILMNDPWRLRLGAGLWVDIELGGDERPVRAFGQIVGEARADQKGVRFDDISPEDRDRLVRSVGERERDRVESGIFRF
jgi:PilZ domain